LNPSKIEQPIAAIFDMDGVIIDNNPYHQEAWKTFCMQHAFQLEEQQFKEHVYGRTNRDILQYLFQREVSDAEISSFGEEKEGIYRSIFEPVIKPVTGLVEFLGHLQTEGAALAVATSAPPSNLDFVFRHLPIGHHFKTIVNETMITNGKPDPEIYLTAARLLEFDIDRCVVFEDSLSGIQSALDAGMKVIGVTTTHSPEELAHTHLTISDFTQINARQLRQLLYA